jgi:hypothetical protein
MELVVPMFLHSSEAFEIENPKPINANENTENEAAEIEALVKEAIPKKQFFFASLPKSLFDIGIVGFDGFFVELNGIVNDIEIEL